MVSYFSGIFGLGLVLLGASDASLNAPSWLTWLDFFAALGAFGLAIGLNNRSSQIARIVAPMTMSLCLFALAKVAQETNVAAPLQISWNYIFAAGFFLSGLAEAIRNNPYGSKMAP